MPIFLMSGRSRRDWYLVTSGLLSFTLFAISAPSALAQSFSPSLSPVPTAQERLFNDALSPNKRNELRQRLPARQDRLERSERSERSERFERLEDEQQFDERLSRDSARRDEEEEIWETEEPLYEDFSTYIFDTTGKTVTDALPIKRSQGKSQKLPDGYQVGPGDRIDIQVWGAISGQYRVTLDSAGRIFIADVGNIPLSGVKASDLTAVITSYFGRIYKGFQLRASVDTARSASIHISGQARSVGVMNVPATNTLLSATLSFAAPSPGGSRRFIEFQRGSGPRQKIDLYCFFRNNCATIPASLQDGDSIAVPPRAKLVAISGAVARPGIYELAEGESVQDLLSYAGGLSVIADATRVNHYAFDLANPRQRMIRSTSIAQLCGKQEVSEHRAGEPCTSQLVDGDYLDVQPKLSLVQNAITLVAPGAEPSRTEFKTGMRLLDVLRAPFDALVPDRVRQALNSGSFNHLNELDEKFKGLDLDAMTVYRLDAERGGFQSFMVSYRKAAEDAHGDANIPLRAGDVILIDTNNEWRSRRDNTSISVRLLGEVRQPGRYRMTGAKTLGDVLDMAGGITPNAAMWGAVVLRQGDARNSVGRVVLDQALRSISEYQTRQEAVNSDGRSATVAPTRQTSEQTLREVLTDRHNGAALLEMMRGRSMVYLSSADGRLATELSLEPYDIVLIPAMPDTFSCQGAFFRVGDMHIANGRLSLDEAASRCGILEEMKPSIYHFVAREGRVCRTGGLWQSCPQVQAGDLLVAVPEAIRKQGNVGEWLDTTLKTLTAIATLKVLSD